MMNVAKGALTRHIHPRTACRCFGHGRLPISAKAMGRPIMVAVNNGMGRRAFWPSVPDAGLGQMRLQLTYEVAWQNTIPTISASSLASSQVRNGCGCRLIEPERLAEQLAGALSTELVDRDDSAALNLGDWPDDASCGSLVATVPRPAHRSARVMGIGSNATASGARKGA